MRLFNKKQGGKRLSSGSPERTSRVLYLPPRIEIPVSLSSDEPEHKGTDISVIAPWTSHDEQRPPGAEPERPVKEHQQTTSFQNQPLEPKVSATSKDRPGRPTLEPESDANIRFLIGQQASGSRYLTPQIFVLPSRLLVHSELLAKYVRCAQQGISSKIPIRLEDIDPNAFAMYCEYLSTGQLFFRTPKYLYRPIMEKWSWAACWPLINAHVMANTLGDPIFAKYVMQCLKEMLDREQQADIETIRHVFTTIDVSDELKHFIVDEAVRGGIRNFGTARVGFYPSSFMKTALERTIQILKLLYPPKDLLGRPKEESPEDLDKLLEDGRWKDARISALKELRDRLLKVAGTREVEATGVELKAEGVDIIDWEVEARMNPRPTQDSSAERPPEKPKERPTKHKQKPQNQKLSRKSAKSFRQWEKERNASTKDNLPPSVTVKEEEDMEAHAKPKLLKIAKEIIKGKGIEEVTIGKEQGKQVGENDARMASNNHMPGAYPESTV